MQLYHEERFYPFSVVKIKTENQYLAISVHIEAYWHKYISVWEHSSEKHIDFFRLL